MLVTHLAATALACGGFACDNSAPVLQAAERIVFGVDPGAGEVEMHVQVTYTGPSEDFAWIVPVPAEPELFVSTADLFSRLALATQPTFALVRSDDGNCVDDPAPPSAGGSDAVFSSTSSGGWDVTVTAEKTVGPYETVTLSAESAEDLVGWLEAEGYDLPPRFEEVARPYVAQGSAFVALRLGKDKDAGDLAPLALRYRADRAVVPVQLTSIAATPDLRMEAYVLSEGRGVPDSYLHVRINDAAVDWWTNGANYPDVISRAADEAGGHAFATDYFGPSDLATFWPRGATMDRADLEAQTTGGEWLEHLRRAFPAAPTTELYEVIEDALAMDGQGQLLWACGTGCLTTGYGYEPAPFDGVAATTDLYARVVDPLQTAQDLLDRYPLLSRMTSSLDAAEMTVDPVFVVNPDLAGPEVSSFRSADLVYHCGLRTRREHADRTLVLADGREIWLPSESDLQKMGMTEYEWLEEHRGVNAQVIEQMGESGEPRVIADFSADLLALAQQAAGCGCDGTGAGGAGGLALAALPWLLRRRRSA
jgi:uncharacterized protein (TIGR03382 family)